MLQNSEQYYRTKEVTHLGNTKLCVFRSQPVLETAKRLFYTKCPKEVS